MLDKRSMYVEHISDKQKVSATGAPRTSQVWSYSKREDLKSSCTAYLVTVVGKNCNIKVKEKSSTNML